MSEELQNNVISSEFFENSDRVERERMYDFTVAFNALLKALRLYGPANETVEKNTEKLGETIKFFFATDSFFDFTFNGNDFMLNDVRVRRKKGLNISFDELEDFYIHLQVATIVFQKAGGISEIIEFMLIGQEVIKSNIKSDVVFDYFEKKIKSKGIKIQITQRDSSGGDDLFNILNKSQLARLTYRNMVLDHSMFKTKINENRPMPLKKAMRNIQNAIDMICDGSSDSQESHLMVLASINSLRGKMIATHLTNTAILSIAAGVQLGIDRSLLTRIGTAAYFHDIDLPENSKGEVVEHCQNGFAVLSRLNSLNFAMMEAAITAGLHHTTYTFDCKPVPPEKPIMSTPLGELIKVCDYYDLATRWWPARKTMPMKRPEAIEQLFKMADMRCFAKVTVKALFSALGVFPPGTILRVIGKKQLACSLDVFRTTGRKGKAAILDKDLKFVGIQEFYPHELLEIPQGLHFRLPPETVKTMLDSFNEEASE
jgi:HD-GYP domain-containing protein (c-di-GMP phosphodiesterase class II)